MAGKIMEAEWVTIRYRGFYDVPRIFLTEYQRRTYLFSCVFQEEIDEYPEAYQVYVMPTLQSKELEGNWEELFLKANRYLGDIPVKGVQFDPSLRQAINPAVIDQLAGTPAHRAES